MKTIFKTLIITVLSLTVFTAPIEARDRKTVALTQIFPSERDLLPDRTIELKVQFVAAVYPIADNLTRGVTLLLNRVAELDYFNNIFLVECTRETSGALSVTITDYDPFATGANVKFDFAMQSGAHKSFLFAPMPVQLKVRKDGKLKIERVFEMVQEKLPPYPTRVKATVDTDGNLTIDPASLFSGETLQQREADTQDATE